MVRSARAVGRSAAALAFVALATSVQVSPSAARPISSEAGANVAGPAPRDFSDPLDGHADLVTVTGGYDAGRLLFQWGNGQGGFRTDSVFVWGDITKVVPLGDMTGDGCNDMVLVNAGNLYRGDGECDRGLNWRLDDVTKLAAGWGQFNVLTSPGDLTSDGRPDVVARQATTGDLYLYDAGTSTLQFRGKIGAKWTAYRSVFGGGDLNGDGIGDMLAVDKANSLWRYEGTVTGSLKPRQLVFAKNWANGRDAFVGTGDITGDGKADLITRNTAGALLRNNGDGRGSFRSTVKIGIGWNKYRSIH